jgi:BlaI family transcriptional regulator, penicillinase repressor
MASEPQLEGVAGPARPAHLRAVAPLGPLQSAVMEGLWIRHPSTAAEITDGLNARRHPPLSTKTILTSLTRLEEKGLVSHSKESRTYLFSPTKSEREVAAWYLGDRFRTLIDRFGDLAVAVFVEQIGEDPMRYRFLRQLVEENDERGGP